MIPTQGPKWALTVDLETVVPCLKELAKRRPPMSLRAIGGELGISHEWARQLMKYYGIEKPDMRFKPEIRICPACEGPKCGREAKLCRSCAGRKRRLWKYEHQPGYVRIPFYMRKCGEQYLNREVATEMLGRSLLRGELVLHLNGDLNDNRPENLEVISKQEFMRRIRARRWGTTRRPHNTPEKSRAYYLAHKQEINAKHKARREARKKENNHE